ATSADHVARPPFPPRRSSDLTFQREIARQEIDGVEARTGLATLVVVGLGMAETPGIAARVFSALAEAGINVIATAQGSSELNLSDRKSTRLNSSHGSSSYAVF